MRSAQRECIVWRFKFALAGLMSCDSRATSSPALTNTKQSALTPSCRKYEAQLPDLRLK
jgi:hypothetical protein